jgi:integrase
MLTATENMLLSPRLGGGDFMFGSFHWHEPAKRYFVSLYWDGKRHKIWRYNGEPIWHEKTANKLLSKIRAEIDDGCFLLQSYLPDSPISLGQYSAQWLKALSVSPATLKFYTKAIQHAVEYFGKAQDIRKFSFSKLQIFYNELPLTIKGKYHVLNTLKTMLKFAYHDEIIKRMPPFPALTQGPQQEIRYLTFEQQQEVIGNMPESDRGVFEFAMEYGLRIGEVIGLQKDCITETEITIRRAMSEGELRQSTKTGKIRVYGITERAKEILDNRPLCASPFVFNCNGKPYSWKMLTLRWRSACKKSGLSINLYNGIRHSLGCQLINQEGVDMEMVRDILGHTSSNMTRRYAQRSKPTMTNVLQFRGQIRETLEKQKALPK